jgi:hypothetical protein
MEATNQQSWRSVLDFVSTFREPLWSDWKAFMEPLLRTCIDAGLDQHFRAGQSMSQIIISTAKEHGLEKYNPPPPRITLGWNKAEGNRQYFVAYSHLNLLNSAPERVTVVTSENAFSVLRSYMAQLWRETQATETLLPKALTETT